jgi:hypothetical protein
LAWVTTIFSTILLGLNIWLTYRLSPVEESIRGMNTRIEAIESRNKSYDPLVERFYKTEEKEAGLQIQHDKDIGTINTSLIRIEGKLDKVILDK